VNRQIRGGHLAAGGRGHQLGEPDAVDHARRGELERAEGQPVALERERRGLGNSR
jgi:hypothetical protein